MWIVLICFIPFVIAASIFGIGLYLKKGVYESISVAISLILFYALLLTVSTGIFFMAKMDLPKFSPHFLSGYILVVAGFLHVGIHFRVILRFFRKKSLPAKNVRMDYVYLGFCTLLAIAIATIGGMQASETKIEAYCGGEEMAQDHLTIQTDKGEITAKDAIIETTRLDRTFHLEGFALSLTRPKEVYEYGEGMLLPSPRLPIGRTGNLTKQELSDLLFLTYGVTKSERIFGTHYYMRSVPSAGALYPADLYLYVQSIDGVQSGLFYYNPINHSIQQLPCLYDLEKVMNSCGVSPEKKKDLYGVILICATYDRTAQKYRERAYRYIALDVGHMMLNVGLTLENMGISYGIDLWFIDKELADFLGLQPEKQGVFGVVFLWKQGRGGSIKLGLGGIPRSIFSSKTLTSFLHGLSSYYGGKLYQEEKEMLFLTEIPQEFSNNIHELIKARRSYRDFSRLPLERELFEKIGKHTLWALRNSDMNGIINIYLVSQNVRGVEIGTYELEGWRLEGGFSRSRVYSASLSQEVVGGAGMLVVIGIDLNKTKTAREVRNALIMAGMIGQTVYLSATELGLGVCGVGAFLDQALGDALNIPKGTVPVYVIAIGNK